MAAFVSRQHEDGIGNPSAAAATATTVVALLVAVENQATLAATS